ncbi:polyamine deacetylase HDAC10 isoform X2 [Betta splendens]|nr:polyamine deacetylase HDAC10 isoform X2 [Betta splendens]
MTGKVRNGMALVRPPGHHSMHSAASGFCIFNNVAIAARYAQQRHGAKRVLIVDWDIHHGQGVQYCFEDDPSVLYFSWHRFEHQKFWPQLKESDFDTVGKEKGAGFNINVPWNKVGMQNSDYLSVFFHILLPVAYEFCPDLVLVSAGFDSAIGDPEGEMRATPDIFAHLTHLLMNLAEGKVCAVLEGGYNLTSLPQSVCQTVHTLLGDPAPCPANLDAPCKSALESLQCVRSVHRTYWSCLRHAADLPTSCSTKHINTAEGADQEPTEESSQEIFWPPPMKRVFPPTRTAVVLPDDVACPDGCKRWSLLEHPDPQLCLSALVDKMVKNEICNGLVLVPDVSVAMICLAQHAVAALNKRLLVVCVGDGMVPIQGTEDGKTLVVHFSRKESEEQRGKHFITVHLTKGCGDASGFIQAVLSLLLPLGYEYDPGLVLLVQKPDSGVCDSMWRQLTGLLQGLAQGHMLVVMQEDERKHIGPTCSSLLGIAAPSLGQLHSLLPEDVEALERLRRRLTPDWKLLQTTVAEEPRGREEL